MRKIVVSALVGWLIAGIIVIPLCAVLPISSLAAFLAGLFMGWAGLLIGVAIGAKRAD